MRQAQGYWVLFDRRATGMAHPASRMPSTSPGVSALSQDWTRPLSMQLGKGLYEVFSCPLRSTTFPVATVTAAAEVMLEMSCQF